MTSPTTPVSAAPVYTVGTLRYNQNQLYVLFFWLMWNDFSITLIERIGSLNGFQMIDHGATYTQMALISSAGFFLPWINPWVSTWSDRHRGKMGRRRPFLFFAAPLFAFFLALYPFMPGLYHYLLRYPWMVELSTHFPMKGDLLFMGVCGLVSGMFNAVLLAIFSYLYWDVVPENLMGRFQSMTKTVSLIAGLVWGYFIAGFADHHVKQVYVWTAIFCLLIYLVSVWQIKEGEYPPPDVHKTGGFFAPIRAYFAECFSESYYLWVFAASLFYQLGNQGGGYQTYYLKYDLHLSLGTIFSTQSTATLVSVGFGLLCGFYVGVVTDRLKPVRIIGPLYILQAVVFWASFYFVHDRWTYLISFCVINLVNFCIGVVVAAFTVEIFPREKLGQFCSAQAVFYQVSINVLGPGIGEIFDHLHNNRVGFLWQGSFYCLCALTYIKVYLNWKKRKGQTPVPHAG